MAELKLDKRKRDKLFEEAKKRFQTCEKYESTARKNYLEDLKFANADAYNRYQWPTDLWDLRDKDGKPCLTINKTRQHNLQIINDARQNKSSIKITPTGDEASYDAAEVFEGVVRYIEYISNAQTAYSTATWFQVEAGIGYIRVITEYEDNDSFDQNIKIRRVHNPLSVYMDPSAKEFDRSDAKFAFVFEEMDRDEFERRWPKYKDKIPTEALGNTEGWLREDQVRVAEYFRVVPKKGDRLMAFTDPATGEQRTIKQSELPPELLEVIDAVPDVKTRDIVEHEVEWYLIAGEEVLEKSIWPGETIPIVPVIGEETVIDGEFDRKGHTRALIDPQRMYNYWTSEATAQVAYQGKTPWVAPVGSYENLIEYYETANTTAHSVLPFNPYDDEGRPLPPPEKAAPPVMSPAYLQGMATAANEMALVSGQYQADFGAPSNERSGKAIQERQRQGDTATYHFIDHFAMAIRRLGKILIDLVPKVYDTPRVVKILAEDETEETLVRIDPKAPQAFAQGKFNGKPITIFNPNVGKYEVQADIGPAFGTRRQEAFNALTQLAGQSPELMKIGGDLVFKAADFPMAEELAERWQRTIPPNIMGEGPDPQVAQLMQQNQTLTQMLQTLSEKLKDKGDEAAKRADDTDIEQYRAYTERMKVLRESTDPQEAAQLAAQLVLQAMGAPLPNLEGAFTGQAV